MSKSMSVTFDDGTSHTYDDVPDEITQEQVNARATEQYPDRKILNVSEGSHPEAPPLPTANQLQQEQSGLGTTALGIGKQAFDYTNQFLSSPIGHLAEGAAAALYGGSKIGSAIRKAGDTSGLSNRLDTGLDLLKQHLETNAAKEARLSARPGFGGVPTTNAPVTPTYNVPTSVPSTNPVSPVKPTTAPNAFVQAAGRAAPAVENAGIMSQVQKIALQHVMQPMQQFAQQAAPYINNPVTRGVARLGSVGGQLAVHHGGLNTNEDAELARRRAAGEAYARQQGWIK